MTDTPATDKNIVQSQVAGVWQDYVHADFARDLERALAAALADLATEKREHEQTVNEALETHRQLAAALMERNEARTLAEEACRRYNESLRVVTCAFCGEPYPPDTPASGAKVLAEHVAICAKHPMRTVELELAATKKDAERYRWLRDNYRAASVSSRTIYWDVITDSSPFGVTKLDFAIDAAIEQERK